ncbi:DUF5682 family protein [Lachnospiraceae bacterium ZAX-1]
MEKPIQCVPGTERIGLERVNFFGVRHLSPAASYHLIKYLDKINPKCVLIEAPTDASSLVQYIADSRVTPPIAILAYTAQLPVSTVLYPLADYSPEYQAVLWGIAHSVHVEFIDIPTDASISLNDYKNYKEDKERQSGKEDVSGKNDDYEYAYNLYQSVATISGEDNYDSYWERNFEHNLMEDAYNRAITLQSAEMRSLLETDASDLVRESFMARKIADAIVDKGYAPADIVVITGAYHAMRLKTQTQPMTDEEMKNLPRRESKLTLMPYSFYRLSNRFGYGAGNAAPEYYELMWHCMKRGQLDQLPMEYITKLGRYIRETGGYCSTANVIEAVRLSFALTYLKGGSLPTLDDLHDACIACIGHGNQDELLTAIAMSDIGVAFGSLPEGLSQTPIQDDMNRELKRLKLEKYKSTISQQLDLDLRENIKVKTVEAAFLDLHRSTFLHRLAFLEISFAKQEKSSQEKATWRENWILSWSPEAEIQLVESVLMGETIELASAFLLKERLEECKDIVSTAKLISSAYLCKLTNSVENAVKTLQYIAADSSDFSSLAQAAAELSNLIQYGNIRQVNTFPLASILRELFFRACLTLVKASACDDKAATKVVDAIGMMHTISQDNFELIDDEAWVKALQELAARDDKNAKLSGLAFAILLERDFITEEFCSKEIRRRLSPGIPADIGAGWFEGMSMRNHYALLSRVELWRELDDYIKSLEDEEFNRSVVFMRRAFGGFEPREKESIAELLSELWGLDATSTAVMLNSELDEDELGALAELSEFDWD